MQGGDDFAELMQECFADPSSTQQQQPSEEPGQIDLLEDDSCWGAQLVGTTGRPHLDMKSVAGPSTTFGLLSTIALSALALVMEAQRSSGWCQVLRVWCAKPRSPRSDS
jgi:hypothetical protein